MKYKVSHDGTTKTYAVLWHTAWHLLETAKDHREGSLLNLQASAVFHAFTFEAYLNHVGVNEIVFWDEIDRISYWRKLKIIGKHLGLSINPGVPPFQGILELFSLRNTLAHGRTIEIDVTYEVDEEPGVHSSWEIHEWEKLTTDKVERYRNNVRGAIQAINAVRKDPDDETELWNQGGRGRYIHALK